MPSPTTEEGLYAFICGVYIIKPLGKVSLAFQVVRQLLAGSQLAELGVTKETKQPLCVCKVFYNALFVCNNFSKRYLLISLTDEEYCHMTSFHAL